MALSRVKSLSPCVIEPISYKRLTSLKSCKMFQYRLNEEIRLDKMAEVTFNRFQWVNLTYTSVSIGPVYYSLKIIITTCAIICSI